MANQCKVPMLSYEKASGKAAHCNSCIHKGVCAFSKEFEEFCNEIADKGKLMEYQHFTATCNCGHYFMEGQMVR